ncbi:MAG: hypothetical protein U0168_02800 [Nannocystaceae bacterium]
MQQREQQRRRRDHATEPNVERAGDAAIVVGALEQVFAAQHQRQLARAGARGFVEPCAAGVAAGELAAGDDAGLARTAAAGPAHADGLALAVFEASHPSVTLAACATSDPRTGVAGPKAQTWAVVPGGRA